MGAKSAISMAWTGIVAQTIPASCWRRGARNGAYTNLAEGFFSRMRRAKIGHHHHVAGAYLLRYAQEAAWREDHRRVANGEQVSRVAALAMMRKPSVDFSGYWQRRKSSSATMVSGQPFAFSNLKYSSLLREHCARATTLCWLILSSFCSPQR